MTTLPLTDHGQTITPPAGKVIGYLDSKTEYDAFVVAMLTAGFQESKQTSLYGEDGIHLLERLKESNFFFADSEDDVIQRSIRELRLGHFVASVEVADHAEAIQIARLAKPHGGHDFNYFGTWVSESLQHET